MFTFDDDILRELGVPPSITEPTEVQTTSRDMKPMKIEFVEQTDGKKKRKQNYIYDTPGVFNESQVSR